ncbi:MAG: hypothetical protein GOU99_04065 [Candidatus Altiarchaeota archaeon]|nr:hypothetical protein [Candidatus Altiarchaeota archaeon]
MENKEIAVFGLVLIALFGGMTLASAKSSGKGGFDDYGYNEKASVFSGCITNYLNWKTSASPIECSETDTQVHANWKFDKDGGLVSLFNMFWCDSGRIMKKFVPVDQVTCEASQGDFWGYFTVSQTGENVPICQIQRIVIDNPEECRYAIAGYPVYESVEKMIAKPAGFGAY